MRQIVNFFLFAFIALLFLFYKTINISAQGVITCSFNGNGNCVMGLMSCQNGYTRPICPTYPGGDCCMGQTCPTTLPCVTPTPQPIPPGCTLSISPTIIQVGSNSLVDGHFQVTTSLNCSWTATTNDYWTHIKIGSGVGNGTVYFDLDNNNSSSRMGTIQVSIDLVTPTISQLFLISQTGSGINQTGCDLSFNPTQIDAPAAYTLDGGFHVYTGGNCNWTAISNNSWIHITIGNGTGCFQPNNCGGVNFYLEENTGPPRTGSITVNIDLVTPLISKVMIINQVGGIIPNLNDCPYNYTCANASSCNLSQGDISRSCSIPSGGTGNCCQKPPGIPVPGNCSNNTTGCFACQWDSTGVCTFNLGANLYNNCTPGYTYDVNTCHSLDATSDYICQGTLFPCVPLRQYQYGECSRNGCIPCNPSSPNCVPFNACNISCNNPDPYACNGTCRTSCLPNENVGSGNCVLNSPVCCETPPAGIPCRGHFTNLPGECHFLQCPPGIPWDGINPPYNDINCPLGYSCCLRGDLSIVERNPLESRCVKTGQLGINTAIGCITVSSQTDFLAFVLPWALGVGGGTAFILIVIAGFFIITSSGDPRRAKAGKELLTSAIIGILMIIFSVFLLDVIGIRILHLPGL